jgi:peptide/nickel transport system substrate-binding protein
MREYIGRLLRALVVALIALVALPAFAADLRVGIETAPTSIDPHFHNYNPNKSLHAHIYDPLIIRDGAQHLTPGLALSWVPVDPTTWEFHLRPGVMFSDGTPFTADDVAFTMQRAATVQGSPSSYAFYLRPITRVTVVGPLTVRLSTAAPFPLLPAYLSVVAIVSRRHGEGATTEDYNSGRAAIGTGPYRFVSWVPQQQVELVRNDRYWGERPQWDRVIFRAVTSPASRLAALMAGDLDLIDRVPTADIARLRGDARFALATTRSPLLVTFFPDHFERVPPFVRDNDGQPLARNPFRDLRVRRAVSLAINRQALADRVMEGEASPTGQFMPEGFAGYLPDVRPDPYDPERARALLAEAGFPDGFQLTIHCMNDRLVNDARICQAVGQMLTRAGIRTMVEIMPNAVIIPRAQRNEFSLWLHGMATETAEPTAILIPSVATTDRERGRGAINRGRYSNPAFDGLLDQALQTLDDQQREAIMARAQRLLIDDLAVIPLYHQVNTWGMRAAVTYRARADESTLAMDASPR